METNDFTRPWTFFPRHLHLVSATNHKLKIRKKINYPVNMFQFLLLILNDSPRSDVELYSVTVRLNQFEGLYLVGRRTRYWRNPTEARPPEGWVAFGCISSLFPRKSNQYNRLSALEQNVKQTSTARIQRRSALLLLASSQWTIAVAVIPIGQKYSLYCTEKMAG